MKILCAFGKYAYGDVRRGVGYEFNNFLPAFKSLGHDVSFIDIWDRSLYDDFSDLNKAFIEKIDKVRPDIIFCVLMGYELWRETLILAKEKSQAILINWSTDDSWKYEQFSHFISPLFDLYVTTYQSALDKAKRDGFNNFVLSQWAANSAQLLEPKEAKLCKYKISFVGAAYGNRRKWIHSLKERGIEVNCFGHGWEHGVVGDDELPEIINDSVVSLNFGDSGLMFRGLRPYRSRQIKARIFEVLGYGGFLVTESAAGLEDYYRNGEDLITFESLDDLSEILNIYLNNYQKRDSVANNGHQKTIASHTYQHRFEEILAMTDRLISENTSRKNHATANISVAQKIFEKAKKKHNLRLSLKILKYILLVPCVILWGNRKGRRAARRIVFEFSWRIAGGKTYTAQGLPGRLFYKES